MADVKRIAVRPFDHHDGPFRKKRNSWDGDNDAKIRFLERALDDAEKKIRMMGAGSEGDLARKVSDLERKNRKLERALDDAEAWIKKLKRKSPGENDCKDHVEKIVEMSKSNKIIKNALEKSERRIKELEEQISDSAEKMMDAYDNVGLMDGEKSTQAKEDLKRAEEKIKQLEKKNSIKSGCDPKTELMIRRALEEAEKKVEYFQSSSVTMEQKLSDNKKENDVLKINLENVEDSMKNLEEELKEKDGQMKLLENELNIAKVTIKDKEVDAIALMKVKKLLEAENVEEKVESIAKEFSSLSNILKNIKDLSK